LREQEIEKYLRDEIKKVGGVAYKFVSPGNSGVPDRIVLLPGGEIHFIELKAPGKKSTALQAGQQERISKLGFNVMVIDSKERVDAFIRLAGRRRNWV